MQDVLDYINNWPVLKWVILVLIAGFIGQFGKMLAEAIITRARRHRQEAQASQNTETPQPRNSGSPEMPSPPPSVPSMPAQEIPDKKMLKAEAKARKKEAKLK